MNHNGELRRIRFPQLFTSNSPRFPRDPEAVMVGREPFLRNDWPTLGVEIELQLIDSKTLALRNVVEEVLGSLPECYHASIKREFMQCYVEINTGVCRTVAEVQRDLEEKVGVAEQAATLHGVRLGWAGTHPFSRWQDQQITKNERYFKLADLLGETVVRPVTFGLHVHVGVDSGDTAVRAIGKLRRYLPLLLALSANSPFFHGRWTGHHAHRVDMLEGLPTGGLPPRMRSWGEYTELLTRLKAAGCIESHHELWWDVRPNAEFGTVEVRICDMPSHLPAVIGLTALIQCLVKWVSLESEEHESDSECYRLLLRQNRWRACRYGLGADLIDPITLKSVPARKAIELVVAQLGWMAEGLGCHRELESVLEMVASPGGSEVQLERYSQTGDMKEVIRVLMGDLGIKAERLHRETLVGGHMGIPVSLPRGPFGTTSIMGIGVEGPGL